MRGEAGERPGCRADADPGLRCSPRRRGLGARRRAGMSRSLPLWFTGTVGTPGSGVTQTAADPRAAQGAPWRGWEHRPSWGARFGEQRGFTRPRALFSSLLRLRMAALTRSPGWDRAGAVGVLLTLLLIEDHLHLVI